VHGQLVVLPEADSLDETQHLVTEATLDEFGGGPSTEAIDVVVGILLADRLPFGFAHAPGARLCRRAFVLRVEWRGLALRPV
jgi:hypothetical protein